MYYAPNSLEVDEDIHVSVRSIWMLQVYASEAYVNGDIVDSAIDALDDELPILVVSMLCDAVEKRLHHELTVGFTVAQAELTRVRGRINLLETHRHRLLDKGRIACQFNELSYDNDVNRYLRHALEHSVRLLRAVPSAQATSLAFRCRRLIQRLHDIGIPTAYSVNRPQGRLHSRDARPVNIAHLLLDLAIPSSGDGTRAFTRRQFSQHELRTLFEKALKGIYDHHLTPKGWTVTGGETLYWDTEPHPLLPMMKTDIILRSPTGHITVIDAKFTSMYTRKHRSGTLSLKSSHLYQLYAYLRTQEHRGPEWAHARGVLAYATHKGLTQETEQHFSFDGHSISTAAMGVELTTKEIRQRALAPAGSFSGIYDPPGTDPFQKFSHSQICT